MFLLSLLSNVVLLLTLKLYTDVPLVSFKECRIVINTEVVY